MKRGLQLNKVVLLGRTFGEYRQFLALRESDLASGPILDIASGVSSFAAEAADRGIRVTAFDPIYSIDPEEISEQCAVDLQNIFRAIGNLPVYRWTSYKNPEQMRDLREKAYRRFLEDYRTHGRNRYVAGALPKLPFADQSFALTFVSYFLFVYQDQFSYEFHRDSIREIMRVTRGEARIYPTVTFEAEKSSYLPLLQNDPALAHLTFSEVKTDFEFLANSNSYLRITHRQGYD